MGVRLLPFLKGKKGWQFAGGGLSADGEGYVLPTASADTLGGVKVGNGLSIDANGVLSSGAKLIASVTADGVKNYSQLFSELYSLIPENVNLNTAFLTIDTTVNQIASFSSGDFNFSRVGYSSTGTTCYLFLAQIRETGSKYASIELKFNNTIYYTDASSNVPANGLEIKIFII